jgi:hypothetical protein
MRAFCVIVWACASGGANVTMHEVVMMTMARETGVCGSGGDYNDIRRSVRNSKPKSAAGLVANIENKIKSAFVFEVVNAGDELWIM